MPVGFRMRKSISIIPGVRLNLSKTGIGYSVGVKGYRLTQRADGRTQRTASLPGTGLSHVTTSGSARRPAAARRPTPAPPAPRPVKPGLFAPKGEKELYKAVVGEDIAAIERVAQEHPELALAASSLAAWMHLSAGDDARARQLLTWVMDTGKDPAADPFIAKYVHAHVELKIVDGATAELGLDRTGVGLALAELHQAVGDLAAAVEVVEQLEPTTFAALSLAELYSALGRHADVVELTNNVVNLDDATALLCVFRGVALREQGYLDAAREALNEALKSKKRADVIRHRALLERARCYELDGKRALARKDLERIMAEDATYAGLHEALAELGA
jgi:tetratricopeptide (TPR) repeat protein